MIFLHRHRNAAINIMTLDQQLAAFPLLHIKTPSGRIAYRRAGSSLVTSASTNTSTNTSTQAVSTLVLLHGIGSSSSSWLYQLQAPAAQRIVLAWNAPGYTGSDPLPQDAPTAAGYAQRMWVWLDALGIERITLAGHSLGGLIAGAAARAAPRRVERLILLAPAGGYGTAPATVREARLRERLDNLAALGPQGMAEQRGAAMLSPQAAKDQIAFVKQTMAQVDPAGYTQAARMLAQGDLATDLAHVTCPITVASGSADGVTPPEACRRIATAARTTLIDLGPVGHICALEAASAVNQLLAAGDHP